MITRIFVILQKIAISAEVLRHNNLSVWHFPTAYRHVSAEHRKQVIRDAEELVRGGKVKRRIVNGEFAYSVADSDENTGQ